MQEAERDRGDAPGAKLLDDPVELRDLVRLDQVAVVGYFFFFQAEDGIRDLTVTGVQTCALPIFLLIGLYELSERREVPYRVAINEAVGLARRFGATDGHKFVNAVLDRAARVLRPAEH